MNDPSATLRFATLAVEFTAGRSSIVRQHSPRKSGASVEESSVIEEQRKRVAAYAASLADINALQQHGQNAIVAACLSALTRMRVADHIDGSRGIDEIAASAKVDPLALRRLIRFL